MSHLVTITTQVREPQAIAAACHRLNLPPPRHGQFEIYRQTVTGRAVQLRSWRYPLVCDVQSGQLHYDNFHGHWGEPARLDEFLQAYAVEHATTLARRQGFSVREQPLPSGAIQLTLQQGGAHLKTIVITISPTGETQLETKGYAGESCREASRWLEQALGQVTADEPTTELYQKCSAGAAVPRT